MKTVAKRFGFTPAKVLPTQDGRCLNRSLKQAAANEILFYQQKLTKFDT